jgi:hypothetical protein
MAYRMFDAIKRRDIAILSEIINAWLTLTGHNLAFIFMSIQWNNTRRQQMLLEHGDSSSYDLVRSRDRNRPPKNTDTLREIILNFRELGRCFQWNALFLTSSLVMSPLSKSDSVREQMAGRFNWTCCRKPGRIFLVSRLISSLTQFSCKERFQLLYYVFLTQEAFFPTR